jgi:hemolysin activation/secretion protein
MLGKARILRSHAGVALPVLLLLSATGAAAQTAPPITPQTREEIERAPNRPTVQTRPRLTIEGGVERAPCALDNEASRNVRFTVGSVVFEDLRGLEAEALRPAYQEFVGTEQPVAVICEIRDRAATILRDAGYVAAVEVPEQRIADGTVRFQVLMAKLVGIRVRGDAGTAEQTIAAYLQRLTEQEVFNRNTAERYLLLAGDIPGYDVRLSLRSANAGRGEVIGEVAVLSDPGRVDFNVQNFGSKDLGRFGGLLRGEFYGLTGLGDRTTLAAFSTSDFEEQQTIQLGHDFRVGSEGLTLSGQFTYAWAEPDTGDPNLEIKARTLLATAEASYPFLRTQVETARAVFGLDFVNQRVRFNDIPLTRDNLRVAFARLDMEAIDPASLSGGSAGAPRWRVAANIQVRQGLAILDASEGCGRNLSRCAAAGVVPPSRFEGDPTGTLIRVEGQGEFRVMPNISFALGARAQYSGDPLLSFEEFSAGNYTVGRGYDPGTLLGDQGIGFQAELRFGNLAPKAADAIAAQPYVFVDAARVRNEDRLSVPVGSQTLASAGAGVRAVYGDRAQLDVVLAVPLKRAGLFTERPDPRLLVSLTTRLWPWSF